VIISCSFAPLNSSQARVHSISSNSYKIGLLLGQEGPGSRGKWNSAWLSSRRKMTPFSSGEGGSEKFIRFRHRQFHKRRKKTAENGSFRPSITSVSNQFIPLQTHSFPPADSVLFRNLRRKLREDMNYLRVDMNYLWPLRHGYMHGGHW
jgi:hypothetical protein